jgi:type IV secretion system protein TrbL
MNALTNSLTTVVETLQAGNERATAALGGIVDALGVIEVVMWGASVLLGSEALAGFVKKFLGLQIWLWIIRGFQELAKQFMKSLVAGAFSAAGGSGGLQSLLDPSQIAGRGLDATLPLAMHIDNLGKWDVGDKVILGLVLMIVMGCFILMAVNIAWAVIEFYTFLNLSGLLIGFALMPQTRFIADKGINAVLACSIKLAVYAFVVALIQPLLANIDFHKTFGDKQSMNWNDIWAMLGVTFFCLGMCLRAPALAAALIHGSPTMSGTGAVMAAAGGAMWLAGKAGAGLGSAIHGSAKALSDWGDKHISGSSSGEGGKKDSPMSEATKAGNMAPSPAAAAGSGVLYGFVYRPASGQLGAPAPNALPADIIDAVAEPAALPANASQPSQPLALPAGA